MFVNECDRLNYEIVEKVNSGKYDLALEILKDDKTRELLMQETGVVLDKFFDFANLAISNVAKEHYDAAVKVYAQACASEVERQARELDSKDKALEWFMKFATDTMSKIDINNTVAVENALKLIESTKSEVNKMFENNDKPSILSVLKKLNFGIRKN